MSETCIFCKIVGGEAPASHVYKDERVTAFLSTQPVNTGHTLVVPKRHCENIFEISEEEIAHLFKVVKKVACAVKRTVNADGIRIVQNNGEATGQVIFHFHIHIIPMFRTLQPLHSRQIREASALGNDAKRIRQFL